jgi:glycosyltransferase involved in cell wall biosynthesis
MIGGKKEKILIDAREFCNGRITGIGRVLDGLIDAFVESYGMEEFVLATNEPSAVPSKMKTISKIKIKKIPDSFLKAEKALSDLSKQGFRLYLSPYPKLPLFGCHCIAVNTVHDVLDLTYDAYRKRFKVSFDIFRLKRALRKADLTWYDSLWSMEEAKKLAGMTGSNPRVRPLGIDHRFNIDRSQNEKDVLNKYHLDPGYVLVTGNGLPHKNPGVLLEVSDRISRRLLFVGVPQANQKYWKTRYPEARAIWAEHVEDEDLPSIIRGAFCVAQPSTAEGYGYPPLEAMACGVPAVISNIPVLVETTGGKALPADPDESKEWIEAFEALEEKDIYRVQIEKGLKWVEPLRGRRGWEKHISDIAELMKGN